VNLTNQLVTGPRRRGPGPGQPRRGAADGSRDRIFAAAAREFAARGFAGASVDRIAATARLNKAMIYYHFSSKAALYRAVLADMFHAIAVRVGEVAGSTTTPEEKIHQFVAAIAAEAEARPHFPPIWFREIAEGGAHVDPAILREVAGILQKLVAIVDDGVRRGRFQTVNPMLLHAGIVGPLLLFFASQPLRARIGRAGPLRGVGNIKADEAIAHVQRVALAILEGRV
jgi:TetR/AcrR family transcriptional regulator